RKPLQKKTSTQGKTVLHLVHIDIWGLSLIKSLTYTLYFLLIVDDLNHFTTVHYLRQKSDALQNL
ncbi:hypothetical protein SELMODRAFT_134781, partial [Selaginella moellendorffii]